MPNLKLYTLPRQGSFFTDTNLVRSQARFLLLEIFINTAAATRSLFCLAEWTKFWEDHSPPTRLSEGLQQLITPPAEQC